MAKKPTESKKPSTPISDFQKKCRLFFSSLSARGCTFLYVNLPGRKSEFVLSNANPDTLMTMSMTPMVAIHHICPSEEFLTDFRNYFLDGVEDPYLIRTEFITKSFKDFRVETVRSSIDENTGELRIVGGGRLTVLDTNDADSGEADDEETESDWDFKDELEKLLDDDGHDTEVKRAVFSGKAVAGVRLTDPFVIDVLESMIINLVEDYRECVAKESTGGVVVFNHESLINQVKTHANWYRSLVFNGKDLDVDHDAEYANQRMLLIDGLDIPCLTEFLKKMYQKGNFVGNFKMYIYAFSGNNARQLSSYEAEGISILSTRPYMSTLLVPIRSGRQSYRHIKDPSEVYGEPR